MQYCKNCGRQLKNGARFCDRCGKSVRQSRNSESSRKQEQIEKLQKERLARKRRQEQLEQIELNRKKRRAAMFNKRKKLLFIIVGAIAAVIIIAVISFILTLDASEWVNNNTVTATAVPTMQPSVTTEPSTPAPQSTEFTSYTLSNNMKIVYPKDFKDDDATGSEELKVYDDTGSAVMCVTVEEYPGGTPSDLMKRFAQKSNGETVYSLAGSGWYGITVEEDNVVKHRKYLIDAKNDLSVYYDFEYEADDENAADYEDYIDRIDKSLSIEKE